MDQQFNTRRFLFLIKLYQVEKGKTLFTSFGVILGIMLLLMTPILLVSTYSDILFILHIVAFFLCVLLGGALFTSTSFDFYGTPSRGIPALMIPASRLEKFLAVFLVNLIFITLLILLYWMFHHLIVNEANSNLPAEMRKYQPAPPNVTTLFNYSYYLVQAVVFLGSIYFNKNSFLKSIGVILILSLGAVTFHYGLALYFTSYPPQLITLPFTEWTIFYSRRYVVDFPEPIGKAVWAFLILMVVSVWFIAYVRLKEKEI